MTLRREVTEARRVVVKVGSSSLTTAAGGIDPDRVRALVDVLAKARERGVEVVLVSSGAIAAGLAPLGLARRPRGLAAQQAAASVGQGLLVHRYTEELSRHGLVAGQVVECLVRAGARQAQRGEFSRRAVLGGKMDLLKAESINELIGSSSEALYRNALRSYAGEYGETFREMRLRVERLLGRPTGRAGLDHIRRPLSKGMLSTFQRKYRGADELAIPRA